MSRSPSARKRGTPRSPAGGVVSPRRARPQRASERAGTLRLFLVFFALIGVNVYFLGIRGGTSIGELLRITRVHAGATGGAPTAADRKPVAKVAALIDDPAGGRTLEVQLTDGQTIAQALTPLLGKKLATTVEEGFAEVLDLASVRASQSLFVVDDADDRAVAVEFRVSPVLAHRLDLTRKRTPSKIDGRSETKVVEAVVPCGAGMWDGLKRAGENPALGELLGRVLGGEGDLAACGPRERLRVIAEKRLVGGRFQRYGRILGVEWVTRAGTRRSFAYGTSDGHYNERGEATARRFLASPVRYARGSGQARSAPRFGPDGRVTVEHTVPPASVVQAVATGTVTSLTHTATGNTLVLTTVGTNERVEYAQLTRVARGLRLGAAVSQGNVLGRCDGGLTITYEGTPAAVQLGHAKSPRLPALSAADRPHFGESIAPVLERMRAVALNEQQGPQGPLAAQGLQGLQGLAARSLSAIP